VQEKVVKSDKSIKFENDNIGHMENVAVPAACSYEKYTS
jgi:hypothetical protein